MKKWPRKFPLAKALAVIFLSAFGFTVGCTPDPPPTPTLTATSTLTPTRTLTPTPTSGSFSYQVRVQAKDTGDYAQRATVTIVVADKAPLNCTTDSTGWARIFIPYSYAGQPGILIVEAIGYEKYVQYIDLIEGALPGNVQLESKLTPIPTFTPTATSTPTFTPTATSTPTSTPTDTLTATPTLSSTPTGTPTATSTSTSAPSPSPTFTPTQIPTPTPTLLPAPILLKPENSSNWRWAIQFEWTWERELQDKEVFSVRIWPEAEEPGDSKTWERGTSWETSDLPSEGWYRCHVVILRVWSGDLDQCEHYEQHCKRCYEEISERSEEKRFYFVPSKPKPTPT